MRSTTKFPIARCGLSKEWVGRRKSYTGSRVDMSWIKDPENFLLLVTMFVFALAIYVVV